jgi:hypothetical protein
LGQIEAANPTTDDEDVLEAILEDWVGFNSGFGIGILNDL